MTSQAVNYSVMYKDVQCSVEHWVWAVVSGICRGHWIPTWRSVTRARLSRSAGRSLKHQVNTLRY